jgi:DHA1 family tetracycline resistance protein-like MFS transporter
VGLAGSTFFYALFGVASDARILDDKSLSLLLLFVARIGAGIAGATIPTAQAYIADTTTLEGRTKGMGLIGMAFGLGFTFGPLLGLLAVPSGQGEPGPWPGYVASALSAAALLWTIFCFPESLRPDSESAGRKIIDLAALRIAVATPSVGLILLASFVCIFSFANFETTLSLLIKGSEEAAAAGIESPFLFDWRQVCLTFAFIGATLAVVQGGIVRRLSGRVNEGVLAATGALLEVAGFGLMLLTLATASTTLLYITLAVVVTGFSFLAPSLNSLLSRRSDPAYQGAILGLGQSVSALARILGAGLGIPFLALNLRLPYYVAAGLMGLGLLLVIAAARGGKDYAASQVAA